MISCTLKLRVQNFKIDANLIGRRKGIAMPIVQIEWLAGRTEAQKAAVVRGVTETLVAKAAVEPGTVWVLLRDVAAEDWGVSGELWSRTLAARESDA
jgi:4-oxalocrotonate tautomerase family enzyme